MIVIRENHSSENDFILNYLKDQHNISEHIDIKKMLSIDEVLRSQLKLFPISSDQSAGKIVIDIPVKYTPPPPKNDKSSVIETKIRGILTNKQPTDFAVKMFEPLNNVLRKSTPIAQLTSRNVKPQSVSNAVKAKTVKPVTGSSKVQKSVKIKTPHTKTKIETKLAGVVKKEKPLRPRAKSVAKAIINSGKGTTKITRPQIPLKSRPLKPKSAAGGKIKKVKNEKGPKLVKHGSISFPRLVKLEKPVPKKVKRKKLVKTPVKKVATKPDGIHLKIA